MTMMTIKRASELVGVSQNTMRIWELTGLVTPSRDSAGRRLYTQADIDKAIEVRAQRLGSRRPAKDSTEAT